MAEKQSDLPRISIILEDDTEQEFGEGQLVQQASQKPRHQLATMRKPSQNADLQHILSYFDDEQLSSSQIPTSTTALTNSKHSYNQAVISTAQQYSVIPKKKSIEVTSNREKQLLQSSSTYLSVDELETMTFIKNSRSTAVQMLSHGIKLVNKLKQNVSEVIGIGNSNKAHAKVNNSASPSSSMTSIVSQQLCKKGQSNKQIEQILLALGQTSINDGKATVSVSGSQTPTSSQHNLIKLMREVMIQKNVKGSQKKDELYEYIQTVEKEMDLYQKQLTYEGKQQHLQNIWQTLAMCDLQAF